MAVPYSWSLPYWSGLASPMASKSQLYNSWLNSSNDEASSPLSQTAADNAKAQAKALADAKLLAERQSPFQDSIGGTSQTSSPTFNQAPTEDSEMLATEGYGLPGWMSSGLGAAASVGLNYAGVPSPIAGTIGSIVGQKAGNGIDTDKMINMGIGKAISAINPMAGMAYGLANLFGLNTAQGFRDTMRSDIDERYDAGYNGGFWGNGSWSPEAPDSPTQTYSGSGIGNTAGPGSGGISVGDAYGVTGFGPNLGASDSGSSVVDYGGLNTGSGSGFDSGSWSGGSSSNESQGTDAGSDTSYSGWKSGGSVGPLSRAR